ncbi:MAG: hypothetical protein U0528_10795 [Anaerolineae bacterium]
MKRMRHLYASMIAAVFLFSSVIAPVRMAGTQGTARLDYLFTTPDGEQCQKPCLFGIRPGSMTFRQAAQLLRQHPLIFDMNESVCSRTSGVCTFRVRLYGASGTVIAMEQSVERQDFLVDDIYLAFDHTADAPILGDVIAALGDSMAVMPHYDCCSSADLATAKDKILRFGPTYSAILYFRQLGIEITDYAQTKNNTFFFEPETRISGMRVFKPYPVCSRTGKYWDRWYGFTSLDYYYSKPITECQTASANAGG